MKTFPYPSDPTATGGVDNGDDEWAWVNINLGIQYSKVIGIHRFGDSAGVWTWEYISNVGPGFIYYFENRSDAMWYRLVWN